MVVLVVPELREGFRFDGETNQALQHKDYHLLSLMIRGEGRSFGDMMGVDDVLYIALVCALLFAK